MNKHASVAASSLLLMLINESFEFYMSNFSVSEEGIKELNEIKLNHEIYTPHSHFQLVGCVRGIVYLVDTDSSNVILWNTELKQVKVMAALNKGEDNSRSVFGFGNVLDAFKFVCIFKNSRNKTLLKIGTLSYDSSWNSMKEFPLDIDDDLDLVGSGKHINGTVNWLMGNDPILSIELGEESVTKCIGLFPINQLTVPLICFPLPTKSRSSSISRGNSFIEFQEESELTVPIFIKVLLRGFLKMQTNLNASSTLSNPKTDLELSSPLFNVAITLTGLSSVFHRMTLDESVSTK
ncbi:hypothetical protein QL285_010971 [Trifolium repens]|nr:hypothetical protein QL285_010971 [Trifolium repens]